MNCPDSVCQQLMTCKWDCPISSVYCDAMWAPKVDTPREPYTYSAESIEERKNIINNKTKDNTRRQSEYYGVAKRR